MPAGTVHYSPAGFLERGGSSRDGTALARSKVPRLTPHLLGHYLHPPSSHNSTSHSSSSHASSLSSSKLISSQDMTPDLGKPHLKKRINFYYNKFFKSLNLLSCKLKAVSWIRIYFRIWIGFGLNRVPGSGSGFTIRIGI
jgi:hypothetical protein